MSCVAPFAVAHDFWLQPVEYWLNPDALTSISLQVGHGAFRQRSPIPVRRIMRFDAVASADAIVDLHEGLNVGGPTQDGEFRLKTPGAYILVLQTDGTAQSHLSSIRFNDYLKVEGLTTAVE